MNLRRTKAVARKEFLHIVRDPRSLMAALGMPILMLVLFGYALSLDVDRVPTAIYDQSNTALSRELINRFRASRYFDVVDAPGRAFIERGIMSDELMLGVVIPTDYAEDVSAGRNADVQLLLDGSDSSTAETALGYAESVVSQHSTEFMKRNANRQGNSRMAQAVEPQIRVWYNAAMKSRNYIVPGLMAVILMIIASLLTSLTIAREWENGTMEQLLSTPVRPVELLLGKLSAYFAIGIVDMLLAFGISVYVLDTPFRGSFILLFAAGLLFLFGALCWGLFISAATRSQHESYQVATMTSFLPAFLLSGFIYAIENMPPAIQAFTHIVPARYFVTILKGIFLKGVGFTVLWAEFAFLAAYAAVIFFLATRKMRQKLV
jgi:ABC-2 type transport system permease protein